MHAVVESHAERPLLDPVELYTAAMVLSRPSPIPAVSGVYAWYFETVPPGVPTTGCHVVGGLPLLYVGISPKAPPAAGGKASRQTIRSRIRYHYRGNAYGSTLRLTLSAHCWLTSSGWLCAESEAAHA